MNRNRILAFSSQDVTNIFNAVSYDDFSQLMFDMACGTEKVGTEKGNNKIREVMYQVLGINASADRRTLRKAIRRHKIDIYEIIEETVENLLVTGWGDNPFFNEFLEIKSNADGDTNEFYAVDDVILTVSELSGNHHDINFYSVRIA